MTKDRPTVSPVVVIFVTALDTTWRAFVPVIGGVFLGIGIDHWLSIAPVATIVCLTLGVIVSIALITKQLKSVNRLRKK